MANPAELPFVRVLTEAFRLGANATEFHGGVGVERRISKLETKLGKFSFAVVQPWLFEAIRGIFGVNDKDFVASIRAPLMETDNGAGKSGASFFTTQDTKFVLKVVKEDAATVSDISTKFLSHFQANPGTFIAPFYALFVVKLKHKNASKNPIVLICMPNSFCKTQTKDFTTAPSGRRRAAKFRRYDLKGLMEGRMARTEEGMSTENTVFQDQDVKAHRQHIWTSSAMKASIRAQLMADCRFLEECTVIDYSLLLGVVKTQFLDNEEPAETTGLRPRNTVGPWEVPRKNHARSRSFESPLEEDERNESPAYENDRRRTATGVRVIEGVFLPKQSRFQPVGEPTSTELSRGGSQAEEDARLPELHEVYLLSIVDTFQTFNSLKAAESKIKNLYKNATIQSPQEYSIRFRGFMEELVKVDVQQEQLSLTRSAAIAIKGAKITATMMGLSPISTGELKAESGRSLPPIPVLGWAQEKGPEFRSMAPSSLPIHTPSHSVGPPPLPYRPITPLTATPPFGPSPLAAASVPLLGSSPSSIALLDQKEDIDGILRAAIQQGGALYSSGQINESCERYTHAARAVLLQTLPTLQKQLWAAMELTPGDQQAWTFRRTFDLILFHEGLRDHDRPDN